MLTVLIRELVPANGEAVFAETLFEAKRVDFDPSREPDHRNRLLVDGEPSVTLTTNVTAYVMNANGKTVATYHGNWTLKEQLDQAGQHVKRIVPA